MDVQPGNSVFVPVMDRDGKTPLMPTTPSRARRWIKSGEATPFFKKGVFCVRLNRAPSGQARQLIVATADPGSKREGFTVKSKAHTYLNVHAEAVTWCYVFRYLSRRTAFYPTVIRRDLENVFL